MPHSPYQPWSGSVIVLALARQAKVRLGIILLLALALFVVAKAAGLTEQLSAEAIRDLATSAGFYGVLLFLGVFVAGNLFHVPGMPFVFAGVVGYGAVTGGVIALLGAVLAVTFTFVIVRWLGGKALDEVKSPLIRKALTHLDDRPLATVFVLRSLFQTSPALNYALAMSRVRLRDYVVGSAMGMTVPVIAVALFVEFLA